MKIEHNGGTIEYNEQSNHWFYSIEDVNGHRQSLADARTAIDKVLDKEKKFQRHEVFVCDRYACHEPLTLATVTSYDENTGWQGNRARVSYKNKQGGQERKALPFTNLYEHNEHNKTVRAEIIVLDGKIEELSKQRAALFHKLESYKPRT